MSPEEQRIAIAEACGWTEISRENRGEFGGLRGIDPETKVRMVIPSFVKDLNAMHEAEEFLFNELVFDPEDKLEWLDHLKRAAYTSGTSPECATAAQRCEAFLRTLNLWKA